ncbi:MAG: hypothetical protein ACC656_07345 [Candidatus Heimdallarchaeota archaeon]
MPWNNPYLNPIIEKAKKILKKHFQTELDTIIRVCSLEEMTEETLKEANQDRKTKTQIDRIISVLPVMRGKYFHFLNEIWVIEEKGENLLTIVHELLHSIQKCNPKRENINFFICYKLLNDDSRLTPSQLKDWLEIEKMVGFEKIKEQFLTSGHCEDF